MIEIAILLKAMNVYSHNAHNLVSKVPFFQDHEAMAEFYAAYDDAYDSVVERVIGLQGDKAIDLGQVNVIAAQKAASYPHTGENYKCFENLLMMEQNLCSSIEALISKSKISEGTRQMLGDICDKSEIRQYKIKQRIKR